jgi:hypothetical protein
MPSAEREDRRFRWIAGFSYPLLLSVYLIYWSHADYFVDDWFLIKHFRHAAGWKGVAGFAAAAAENRVYQVFRMQWLSILYGFLITALGGYSPRFNFAALLLLHAASAWLLSQAVRRAGFERGLAFLAGVFYLLAPMAHFGLLTYLANPFFVLSTFWVLLLLWFSLGVRRRGMAELAFAAACAVAALFSGEQVFLLVWAIVPLTALFLRRKPMPAAWPAAGAIWAAASAALAVYLLWINRLPVRQTGIHRRYEWTSARFASNLLQIGAELRQLSGVTSDSLFHFSLHKTEDALALAGALLVTALVWKWRGGDRENSRLRHLFGFAACGAALAYAPVMWIAGGFPRFRYHYAPAPYLGLAAAVTVWACGRSRWTRWSPAALAGLVTGFLIFNAAADLRQSWIPESEQQHNLEVYMRQVKNIAPGDIFVVSGTPPQIGTAPHFSMHSTISASAFVELVTGLEPLEAYLDFWNLHGRLVRNPDDLEHFLSESDLARTHVLMCSYDGRFSSLDWIAIEIGTDSFRLLPLKGVSDSGDARRQIYSREQLALSQWPVYFPKIVRPRAAAR